MKRDLRERFYDNKFIVHPRSRCWIWIGPRFPNRYGRFNIYGRRRLVSQRLAHRISWEIHFGKITRETVVCHQCDHPSCVNPEHLFIGTTADNLFDMRSKNRHRFGSKHPYAKVTEADIVEIRSSALSGAQLAEKFGVSEASISRIRSRKVWKHVA